MMIQHNFLTKKVHYDILQFEIIEEKRIVALIVSPLNKKTQKIYYCTTSYLQPHGCSAILSRRLSNQRQLQECAPWWEPEDSVSNSLLI